jgi:hypothetical protein
VGCSSNLITGRFTANYQAEIDNNCASPISATVTHYLQLSTDGATWDNWEQTTPTVVAFQPSPATNVLTGSFANQLIPGSYSFYRVWSQVAQDDGCEVFDYYSVAHSICQTGQNQPLDVCAIIPIPTPRPYTVSYYEGTIDPAIHMEQGCLARRSGEQGAVVLDYGSPRIMGTPGGEPTYAAGLLRNDDSIATPARLDQIKEAVEAYAAGYYKYEGCPPLLGTSPSPTPATAYLKVIVGTTNSYLVQSGASGTPTYVPNPALTTEHGAAWARMVATIASDMESSDYPGVTVAGGYDAEPNWWVFSSGANPTPTYNWASGYDAIAANQPCCPYYDFGSMDGGTRDSSWMDNPGSNTRFDQVYKLAYGFPSARALPEIYTWAYAKEWYQLQRYSHDRIAGSMLTTAGVMTNCGSAAGCTFTQTKGWPLFELVLTSTGEYEPLPPPQGWQAMYDAYRRTLIEPLFFNANLRIANAFRVAPCTGFQCTRTEVFVPYAEGRL